jgi:signal transduction histidine kinase
LDVEFHPAGIDHLILEPDAGIHVFRLIQEGLNNIWNHAGASRAIIKLVRAFPNIILRIEDNGKGFDEKRRMVQVMEEKRMGLQNMEERARLLHGQMKVQSRPKVGTIISIKFPYEENRYGTKKDHINP